METDPERHFGVGLIALATLLVIESVFLTWFLMAANQIGCQDESGRHCASAGVYTVALLVAAAAQIGTIMWGTAEARQSGRAGGFVAAALVANGLAIVFALIVNDLA